MFVALSTLTTAEIEHGIDALSFSAAFLRGLGHYSLAAQCKSRAQELNQHLLRREADHRQMMARQLSLAPPGAYENPSET
jgi:hypothetical protein